MGIEPATHTQPVGHPYSSGHGFTRQNKPKNIQNSPEMKEIYPISMNFVQLAVSPSVLVQKICFWTRLKADGLGYCDPHPTRVLPVPVTQGGTGIGIPDQG